MTQMMAQMTRMLIRYGLLILLAVSLLVITSRISNANPVVLELFTSQGCSSCPPADNLLEQLQDDPDVIALSYHISYWDNAAWKDPFSSAASTELQRTYSEKLQIGRVFTPQLIINGTESYVGSDSLRVVPGIAQAKADMALIDFAATPTTITLPDENKPLNATIQEVGYIEKAATDVKGGENADEHLTGTHIVTSVRDIGSWNGKAKTIALKPSVGGLSRVILIRDKDSLKILGAKKV